MTDERPPRTADQDQDLRELLDHLGVDLIKLRRWNSEITMDWVYDQLYRWACAEFRRRLYIDYPDLAQAMLGKTIPRHAQLGPLELPATKDDEVRYDLIEHRLVDQGLGQDPRIAPGFKLQGTITGRIPRDDGKFRYSTSYGRYRDPVPFFGHKEEIVEDVVATAEPGPVSIVPPEIGERAKQEYLRAGNRRSDELELRRANADEPEDVLDASETPEEKA